MTRPPHVAAARRRRKAGARRPRANRESFYSPANEELGPAGHPCHMMPEGRVAEKNQEERGGVWTRLLPLQRGRLPSPTSRHSHVVEDGSFTEAFPSNVLSDLTTTRLGLKRPYACFTV